MAKALDLTGQRFGKLIAIKRAPSRNDRYTRWICQCDCGNKCEVKTDQLRNGHTTSCGCLSGRLDKTGQRFGKLTVLKKLPGGKYLCQCDCGNQIEVITRNLTSGNTKSCGCYHKERMREIKFQSLIGQRFGKLTVLKESEKKTSDNKSKWICQCDCGTIIEISGHSLKQGHTKSCGCIKSFGEEKIGNLLTQANIQFQKEYSFKNCYGNNKNYPLKFDFYISSKKYLIEYDGEQHFQTNNRGWNNKQNLENTQYYDKIKNEYCLNNNIPLIRIPYWHLPDLCIEDLLPEKSKFLINGEN